MPEKPERAGRRKSSRSCVSRKFGIAADPKRSVFTSMIQGKCLKKCETLKREIRRRNLPRNIKIENDSMIRTETIGITSNSETEKAYRN